MSKFLKKHISTIVTFIIVGISIIVSIYFLSHPVASTDLSATTQGIVKQWTGTGELTVISKNPIDLGNIGINNGKVLAKFVLRNTGKGILIIRSGESSCMCTEAIIQKNGKTISPKIVMSGQGTRLNLSLAPNEEVELIALFDPLFHGPTALGPIKRDISLTTDSAETGEVRASFFGTVIR